MLDSWFIAAQAVALLGWVPLFALPWVGRGRAIILARAAAAALCLLYLGFFAANMRAIPIDGGYTLAAIGRAFDVPALLLAGWIHYLAFDLWVGAWEAEHAERAGIRHAALLPCLFGTMMIGPLGLASYLAVAGLHRRRSAA